MVESNESQQSQEQLQQELNGLLKWAIEHSDPDELRDVAAEHKNKMMTDPKFRQERMEDLKNIMESMSSKATDTDILIESMQILESNQVSIEDKVQVLLVVEDLVGQIDNAVFFGEMKGATLLARLSETESLRSAIFQTFGVAASNNPSFQSVACASCNIVEIFLDNIKNQEVTEDDEVALKAIFGLASLLRNNAEDCIDKFKSYGGLQILNDVLANRSRNLKLRKRAVALLYDLLVANIGITLTESFADSLLSLLEENDLDLLEKCLLVINLTIDPYRGYFLSKGINRQFSEILQHLSLEAKSQYVEELKNLLKDTRESLNGNAKFEL